MTDSKKNTKRGPKPKWLKIEGDPEEALRKLLTPQPQEDEGQEPESDDSEPESP